MKNFIGKYFKICPRTGRFLGLRLHSDLSRLLLPLTGLAALIWILIRVVPKPSRTQYPCVQAATPLASSFVLYIASWLGSAFFIKKARKYFRESRFILFLSSLVLGIILATSSFLQTHQDVRAAARSVLENPNQPMGVGKGIFPGRVAWVRDTTAVDQTSASDYVSLDNHTNQTAVNNMLSRAMQDLTGMTTDSAAWDALFHNFNQTHGRGDVGYTAGEKIVIKINLNNSGVGPAVDGSPKIVYAVLDQLVNVAGVVQADIGFGDPGRTVSDIIWNDIHPTFPDVKYWGDNTAETPGRTPIIQSTNIEFHSSDGQIDNRLPQCYVDATYMINIPVFKQHHRAGISLSSKNHFGSLLKFSSTGNAFPYHYSLPCTQGEGTVDNGGYGQYRIFVDFIGHKDLGGKTILYLIDALWSSTNWGDPAWKWRMAPFNTSYPASIFVSQDPVAIESVGFDFLHAEFYAGNPNGNDFPQYSGVDDFLHQAADSVNWAQGILYDPEGDGTYLPRSMGVHEHWNNDTDKQYSRNLGSGEGIELVEEELGFLVGVARENSRPPQDFEIYPNYPNPFNPSTTISYALHRRSSVRVTIYDVQGRSIRSFPARTQSAGYQRVVWDGRADDGSAIAGGIYMYRIRATSPETGTIIDKSSKMILLK
jgi:hypothetical protein